MKVVLTFKMPDAVEEAIRELGDEAVGEAAKIEKVCRKWVEHGEYIRVEVDTEKETCEVLRA